RRARKAKQMQLHLVAHENAYPHKAALVIVCLYLIFAPVWGPGISPRLYDDARYLELGLLALVVVQLLLRPVADALLYGWKSLGRIPRALIVTLLAGGALSAWVSPSAQLGALEIGLVMQLVILFLAVSGAVRDGRLHAETLLSIAVCSGAALFVLKFWLRWFLYLSEGKLFPWLSPFQDFANVRFFSQYQAYSLFLIMLPAFLLRLTWTWRIVIYIIAANFWSLQWMVGARGVWAGFAAAAVMVLVFAKNGRLAWLREQALVVSAGGLISLLFLRFIDSTPGASTVPKMMSIVERGQDSIWERIALWGDALEFIQAHPLLGVGPGQFGLQDYLTNAAHPHNVPLQLLSEYGIVAGVAGIGLGIILVLSASRLLRARTSNAPDPVSVSVAAALVMGLTDSLFSGNLIMPHSQVLFCVVAGWLIGRAQPAAPRATIDSPPSRTLQLTLVSTAMLATAITTVLAVGYFFTVQDMPLGLLRWNPHFWQYGRFAAW
ncbi:MAG: O-antigen ligase family protein, partial [Burkholderiales bacterium]